jgi:hypothetical protein
MTIELTPITRLPDDPKVTTKGSFQAGTAGLFCFTFSDIEGSLFDPSDINLTILDRDGNEITTGEAADRLSLGYYVFEWEIPSDQATGLYSIRIDYTTEQIDGSTDAYITETFIVSESDIDIIDPIVITYRTFLEYLIGQVQRIRINHEIGRLNRARTMAVFTFPRWNQPAGCNVYVNGTLKDPGDGYEVDFLKGHITFSSVLSEFDEIHATYTFRWFTDSEMDAFIAEAVNVFNQYPPHTVFSLGTLAVYYGRAGVTVAHQAAVFALRRIIMDMAFQDTAKIFGGMDRADKLMSALMALKQNFEESLKEWYAQKKYGPYVGLTRTLSVPEFTLPGGRSKWVRSMFKGNS